MARWRRARVFVSFVGIPIREGALIYSELDPILTLANLRDPELPKLLRVASPTLSCQSEAPEVGKVRSIGEIAPSVPALVDPEHSQLVIRTHVGQERLKFCLVQNEIPLQY